MNKYLKTLFLITLCCVTLTGCSRNRTDDNENDTSGNTGKFGGDVSIMWDDVKDDFDKINDDVENNTDYLNTLTKEDLTHLVSTVQNGYEKIKNGINKDNQEEAIKVYEAAAKLEYLAEKYKNQLSDDEREVLELGRRTKALIMHYYGNGEGNYDEAVDDVEDAFDRIKDFTDDKWEQLKSKFE